MFWIQPLNVLQAQKVGLPVPIFEVIQLRLRESREMLARTSIVCFMVLTAEGSFMSHPIKVHLAHLVGVLGKTAPV